MHATKWNEATPEQFAELEQALGPRPKYPPITDAQRRAELDADRKAREKRMIRERLEALATIGNCISQFKRLQHRVPSLSLIDREEYKRMKRLCNRWSPPETHADWLKAGREFNEAKYALDAVISDLQEAKRERARRLRVEVIEGWNI